MIEIAEDYLVNEKTVLITGEYDQYGNLFSKVLEGNKIIYVKMPPIQLINLSLVRLGSSFIGARHSSKALLSGIRMHPITVNTSLGIWLFPSKSFGKSNCVWFSLMHVRGTKKNGLKKTIVQLSYGHTYEINMKEASFNQKRKKAEELREIVIKHTKNPLTLYVEREKGIRVVEEEETVYWLDQD
ncbi:competence protein ComK [Neobacillus notoginsengisoli]|uniref:competence protein ComK n=1 Tax=Neobacillus notoginsengisoli TaxID=1578198 RepID=UPI00131422D4|nr:competence protein ComK [Neobacillus notoginsengisoli]